LAFRISSFFHAPVFARIEIVILCDKGLQLLLKIYTEFKRNKPAIPLKIPSSYNSRDRQQRNGTLTITIDPTTIPHYHPVFKHNYWSH
tara:strand:- start:746 stop:1009 length:264 start_codon:yes stop_codon:yes gene_type:complete